MWHCVIERLAYSSESTNLVLGINLNKGIRPESRLNDSIPGQAAFRSCRFMWTREEACGRVGWRSREIEKYGEMSDEHASNKRAQTTFLVL